MNSIEAYIRHAAQRHGIDPDVAVRVAMSEGGMSDPFRQGDAMLKYGREQSYGPFQLHMQMGGLGTRALAAGIDPRKDWQGGVDYALKEASQKGWGQWYGAAKAGIGNQTGIGADGPKGQEAYPPVFGSMSPSDGGMMAQNNSIDPNVAAYAFDKEPKSWGDRLKNAGAGFDAAMSEVKAPRIAAMPSPSGDVANGLSKLLQNPQALAQMLMQRRMV